MGKTTASVKNRWNTANYRQIKICAPPEIASAFKSTCQSDNVSMSGEIIAFMKKRVDSKALSIPEKDLLMTRAGRRAKLYSLIHELYLIKGAEQAYQENIPSNLQGSIRYDAAEECVTAIEEAIDLLNGAF